MLMVGTRVFSLPFYTLFDGPEIFQTYLWSHSGSVQDRCDLGQRFQKNLLASLETLDCANSLHLGTSRFLCIWGDHMNRKQCPPLVCMLIASWYINHMYLVNKILKIKRKDNRDHDYITWITMDLGNKTLTIKWKRKEMIEIMTEASGFYSKP